MKKVLVILQMFQLCNAFCRTLYMLGFNYWILLNVTDHLHPFAFISGEVVTTFLCAGCRSFLRFARCCDSAMQGALKLVALCSDLTEDQILTMYKKACKLDPSNAKGSDELAEDEVPDMEWDDDKDVDPALDLLEGLQRETVFVDPDEEDDVVERSQVDDWGDMPDKDQLDKLLNEEDDQQPQEQASERMPGSLLEAMQCKGCVWNALFRYVVRLRSSPGGCDVRWVPRAREVRRRSPTLNWHQYLC